MSKINKPTAGLIVATALSLISACEHAKFMIEDARKVYNAALFPEEQPEQEKWPSDEQKQKIAKLEEVSAGVHQFLHCEGAEADYHVFGEQGVDGGAIQVKVDPLCHDELVSDNFHTTRNCEMGWTTEAVTTDAGMVCETESVRSEQTF